MSYDLRNKLVIAISSRALFDLEHENAIYDKLMIRILMLNLHLKRFLLAEFPTSLIRNYQRNNILCKEMYPGWVHFLYKLTIPKGLLE